MLLPLYVRNSGYKVFTRPNELNIVGIRNDSTKSNSFDDVMKVFWFEKSGRLVLRSYSCTTDPGTFWLQNPSYSQGTAILAPGQYLNAYQIGLHRGNYTALVQRAPVMIIRDYDRDAILDFDNGNLMRGLYGINIHRARSQGTTKVIDEYSAGCQVLANAENFDELIYLSEIHEKLYGNISYTLLDERAKMRTLKRRAVYAAAAGALLYTFNKLVT